MNQGIYDLLVTEAVQRALDTLDPSRVTVQLASLEEGASAEYLARHLLKQVKIALEGLPRDQRLTRQVELANRLVGLLGESAEGEAVTSSPEVLQAIHSTPVAPARPTTPLAQSDLLMNAVGQSRLGFELEREMETADSVLMLVSFIKWCGWQRLRPAFEELARRGKPVRILTTTYIGATDFAALEVLTRLPNVELKVSLDSRRRRLHAKAWLFERENGFSTAYVGSANLSAPALEDGIEWTVRLSEVETPHNVNRFRAAFATLWEDPEFERMAMDDAEAGARVRAALQAASGSGGDAPPLFFDLRPHPYQQATLDQLEAERSDRNQYRNLVVAPTGTGKTMVAAFDYQRQIGKDGLRPRLLFLAHREEILRQAIHAFRHLLRDENFGDILAGGERVRSHDHVFATIQSFRSQGLLERLGPDYWHYAVLDEAHHTPAQSYGDLIAALRPGILLGLTATPERMDGVSILPWFGGHIADEMRLWHALELQYLSPFDYYGIYDGTDLSALQWARGAYQVADLERLYSGNLRRAGLVVQEFCSRYGEGWREARALGFCVSVEHAVFMARIFEQAGLPALAVTSHTPSDVRSKAAGSLRTRQVNVLFTVDLYNEGVDIPEVDCLLFLRPTESATVFLQQMGRGLRLNLGKQSCLILDFIGNQRREFRFDLRFRALFGGTRQEVIQQITSGRTRLPGNCYFRLDPKAQETVLANLKARLQGNRKRMVAEIQALKESLGRASRLIEFLAETHYDLEDVYKSSWGSLLGEVMGHGTTDILSEAMGHLLHVDSSRRLRLYEDILRGGWKRPFDECERREVLMATFALLQRGARDGAAEWNAGLQRVRESELLRNEMLELIEALRSRIRLHVDEQPARREWPLYLHRSYSREEVLTAVGYRTIERTPSHREGVLWLKESAADLFFVTLEKTEKQYSPTTRYEDYAVSPTRFHWQSQSTTTESSPTGRRYIEQAGSSYLFVRGRKGEAFTFLGPVRYGGHTGSRPMNIHWELEHALPPAFFELCASLRAA